MNKVVALGVCVVVCIIGWFAWPTTGVPILAYHQVSDADDIYSVTADQFEEQMNYLASKGYTAISLEELFNAYEGKGTLPSHPIVITFDDGYEDNFLTALPIMEKYHMRSTVFVVSGLVGTTEYLSWQQISEMQERHTEIGSHTVSHIGLSSLSPEQQRREIVESKVALEEHIRRPIQFLAYPYGEFSPITEQLLNEARYRGACSGIAGLNREGADVYALKRINIPHPKYGLGEFCLRLFRAHLYSKLGI
ncbi:polysaccharide deacetylase family protein [Pelosinus sp. sgz500959]|uniref:polysaccharide deacetylase family protein n=1 Tax=Pelosinus sp. sgz500959 TaxID=3242472 RepID=UPI0036716F76